MFVVTGATSGIGKALAIALAERDMPVLAVARRTDLLLREGTYNADFSERIGD